MGDAPTGVVKHTTCLWDLFICNGPWKLQLSVQSDVFYRWIKIFKVFNLCIELIDGVLITYYRCEILLSPWIYYTSIRNTRLNLLVLLLHIKTTMQISSFTYIYSYVHHSKPQKIIYSKLLGFCNINTAKCSPNCNKINNKYQIEDH